MTAAGFSAMLENATLEGTWAPTAATSGDEEKSDRYQIVRAEPKQGDAWAIVWKIRRQGRTIDYPIPAIVKFAGDCAVLILDDVPVGDGKMWSARILFQSDRYVGRWWNKEGKGGTVAGQVRREPVSP